MRKFGGHLSTIGADYRYRESKDFCEMLRVGGFRSCACFLRPCIAAERGKLDRKLGQEEWKLP